MNNKYIICVDTETTGLSIKDNEIIQLSACVIDPRTLEIKDDTFDVYIKPQKPANWSKGAEAVHGITLKSLEDKIHPKVAWESFVSYVNKYNSKGTTWTAPIIMGHNVAFDLKFLNILCKKYGPWDKKYDRQSLFSFIPEYLDTMILIFHWCYDTGVIKNLKLDSMIELLEMEKRKDHSALDDVKVTAEIFIKFMKLTRRCAANVKFGKNK